MAPEEQKANQNSKKRRKTVILRVFDSKGRIFFFQGPLKGIKKVESNSQKYFFRVFYLEKQQK